MNLQSVHMRLIFTNAIGVTIIPTATSKGRMSQKTAGRAIIATLKMTASGVAVIGCILIKFQTGSVRMNMSYLWMSKELDALIGIWGGDYENWRYIIATRW